MTPLPSTTSTPPTATPTPTETKTTSSFYSVPDLSPDDARSAAAAGTTLLLLDVPEGTVVGVDHRSFVVGPRFRGIKMIPPGGVHFVSTNATSDVKRSSSPPSLGPTNFFFFHARPSSVVVRRWSAEHEVLVPLEDEDDERRYAAGVANFDFDSGLAPYDLRSWPLWRSLTRFVSKGTVERIAPKSSQGKKVVAMSVVAEAEEVERRKKKTKNGVVGGRPTTEAEKRLDEQLERGRRQRASSSPPSDAAPQPVPDVVGAPRYAQLPRHAVVVAGGGGRGGGKSNNADADATADDDDKNDKNIDKGCLLTAANLDKTSTLVSIVRSSSYPFRGDARELLGEFQHAFVSFWAGHSLLAFAAWRDALRLVFSCVSGPCLPSLSPPPSSSPRKEKNEEEELGKEIDGAWFRAFVDTLSSQLEVATTTTTTSTNGSSSSTSTSSPLVVDDLLYDSFLRKSARRFLEGIREAAEEGGGVDVEVVVDGQGDGKTATSSSSSRSLPAPSPELLASCARLSRVLEERLGWAGLGKPRLRELRIDNDDDDRGGGNEDDDSDDSDGPVVVDLEKGY